MNIKYNSKKIQKGDTFIALKTNSAAININIFFK